MADELTVAATLTVTKSPSPTVSLSSGSISVTVSGSRFVKNIQNVDTSEEALQLGDLSGVLGWCLMINRDTSNYVRVRAASAAADLIRMEAGEPALFRLDPAITPYVIADTAACDLEYVIVED